MSPAEYFNAQNKLYCLIKGKIKFGRCAYGIYWSLVAVIFIGLQLTALANTLWELWTENLAEIIRGILLLAVLLN